MRIMINSGRIGPFKTTRKKLILELAKRHKIFITTYENSDDDFFSSNNIEIVKLNYSKSSLNFFSDILLIKQYYKIIKKYKIDAVHSYTIKPNIYGSIAARLAKIKKIYPVINGLGYVYTYNDIKSKFLRIFVNKLYKVSIKKASMVFFQNQDDRDLFIEKKIVHSDNSMTIKGSGIDLDQFKYSENFPSEITFLMMTRLLESKGVMYYLEAAKTLIKDFPNVRVTLAGSFDENPKSLQYKDIKPYVSEGIIHFLGRISNVQEVLEETSVFVLNSHYREGIPHSILEAMAVGRAIITTNSIGCKETVIPDYNGLLVKKMSAQDLYEKMKWIVINKEKIPTMGKNSYYLARNIFDVNQVNTQIIKHIESTTVGED